MNVEKAVDLFGTAVVTIISVWTLLQILVILY